MKMRTFLTGIASALIFVLWISSASAIQCVPYARSVSGINLRGDAWRWWDAAAAASYDRGRTPQAKSVLVFSRQGHMRYGHVSVVTRVVNSRTILVDHANWAPARSSGRGAVTVAVPVLDVSPNNDWSSVRVWFGPTEQFGSRVYRVHGFIYNPHKGGRAPEATLAVETIPNPDAGARGGNTGGHGSKLIQAKASSAAMENAVKTAKRVFRRKPNPVDVMPFN